MLPVRLETVAAAQQEGEGQQGLHLDLGRLLPVGPEIGEGGPGHRAGARGEAQLVLRPAEPLGLAPRAQREDPVGVLHDALAAGALLDDGDQGVVVESDRGVDPEEPALRVGGPDAGRLGLAHRAHPPRAVPRSPEPVGGQGQLPVAHREGAGPRAHLGEAGGVEGHPAELAVEVPRLQVGLGEPVVDGVELEAPLVGLHDDPDLLEALQDLHPDRADRGVHPVGSQGLGRAHHPVVPAPQHRDEGVGHAEVGVLAHPDHREQLVLGAVHTAGPVDVEVVAVVEIAVRGPDEAHGLGDLVDRVVVKGGEHRWFLGIAGGLGRVAVPVRAGSPRAIGA